MSKQTRMNNLSNRAIVAPADDEGSRPGEEKSNVD
jgi:hypothetical protein